VRMFVQTRGVNPLPCPFCGGRPSIEPTEKDGRERWAWACSRCDARSGRSHSRLTDATRWWNRRAWTPIQGTRKDTESTKAANDAPPGD
jgi:hypothetical protein